MRISDWSSDVCSSDLIPTRGRALDQVDGLGRVGIGVRGSTGRGEFAQRPHRCRICQDDRASRGNDSLEGGRARHYAGDRKSVEEGKSVSVRVDLGGRRMIKKKKN